MRVAALYVRPDTIYREIPGVDCWDAARDARLYAGPWPVVAHPPCQAWCSMRISRRALHKKHGWGSMEYDADGIAMGCGPIAVHQVQEFGGVLEHPASSALWRYANLPRPDKYPDDHGGYSIEVDQVNWGHRARKRTWLYIVGAPEYTLDYPPLREAETTVGMMGKDERNRTPPDFARWLVDLAARCAVLTTKEVRDGVESES